MVKINNYEYQKSTRKNKKLMVKVNNKTIHFGDSRYKHFKDKTGIWKKLDTNESARRDRYRKRHGAIKLKDGSLAKDNVNSASYHAWRILW
mgnify:CR=1 FL=1|tara:strand:- start:2863 stop:3135 length:273 start_codon:yes stop_codon:yes gene_type:complete